MSPITTPDWPDNLDAMIAAPAYHSVRVLDTTVPPGHTVPLHTHRWSAVHYILSWSDFIRRDQTGAILVDTRNTPRPPEASAQYSGPLAPHTLENIGGSDLRVISVELKNL